MYITIRVQKHTSTFWIIYLILCPVYMYRYTQYRHKQYRYTQYRYTQYRYTQYRYTQYRYTQYRYTQYRYIHVQEYTSYMNSLTL